MQRPISPNQPEHGRFAAGLFAATVVITGGGGICLTIALVFAKDVWTPVAIILCGLGGLVVALWMMMDRPVRQAQDSNLYVAQKEAQAEYIESFEPQHRRRKKPSFGTNPPPSADNIRQIREDSNVWTPSDRRAAEYRKNLEQLEDL